MASSNTAESSPLSKSLDAPNLEEKDAAAYELPPEEGIRGWLCVVGAFLTVFSTFGFLNAVGVFQDYYQIHFLSSYTPSDISWIFAFQLMAMWVFGPLVGRIVDTYGPSPILYPASILCIFALCMTSLATEYYQIFLAQGVAFGIGAGSIFTASFVSVGQWFVRRRGLAIGITSGGSSLGGVIFPLFFDKTISEVGFAGAMRYAALLVGIPLVIGCALVNSRLPRKKWDKNAKWFEMSLFLQPQFALYSAGSFLAMWGLWVPLDYITTYAQSQGFSRELSFALIAILNATPIPGRILPPFLSDKIGHFNVIAGAEWLIGITILCLWLPFDFHHSHGGIIAFTLVYGFVSGSFVSLILPCVAKIGTIDTIGVRFGTLQLLLGLSLPISGAILTRQGGSQYWGQQTFAVVAALLGAGLTTLSTILIGRAKGTRWI